MDSVWGYANYRESGQGIDVSVRGIYGSVGYQYTSGNLVFIPEVRLGVGVKDDTVMGVDVEVDNFFAASVRAQYNVTESFGVFLQPSYGRLAVTARVGNASISDDEWEFGFGGGVSFKLSDAVALEALYESFGESDVVSIALRYHF